MDWSERASVSFQWPIQCKNGLLFVSIYENLSCSSSWDGCFVDMGTCTSYGRPLAFSLPLFMVERERDLFPFSFLGLGVVVELSCVRATLCLLLEETLLHCIVCREWLPQAKSSVGAWSRDSQSHGSNVALAYPINLGRKIFLKVYITRYAKVVLLINEVVSFAYIWWIIVDALISKRKTWACDVVRMIYFYYGSLHHHYPFLMSDMRWFWQGKLSRLLVPYWGEPLS